MAWYHVAEPSSYLAVTGAGIPNVLVRKKALVLPFQRVCKFSITPFDFTLSLQAMTVEKLNFSLPAVFTIGPDDKEDALIKYAVLLTGDNDGRTSKNKSDIVGVSAGRNHVQSIVKGIIEGETRSIVSTMTMEELFKERRVFRDKVIHNVQSELDQFGLKIYNANVKELQDTPGSEYFSYLSKKSHEGALNQAKVDVAEARMKGEVGEAQRQGQAKQEVAKIHADTAVKETQRKAEKAQADAELTNKEINIEKDLKLARIEAARIAEQRDTELQRGVEVKRREMELERQRASTVTKAIIQRESEMERANAQLYTQTKNAEALKVQQLAETDADVYKQTKSAEVKFFTVKQDAMGAAERRTRDAEASKQANKFAAEASLYTAQKEAEASLERIKREAEGKKLIADAEYYAAKQRAAGMMEMAKSYGAMADVLGGPSGVLQYMMLERGTYEHMANANAKAINGLQPKINVWNTGSGAEVDSAAPIRNLFQALPPLLSTIQDQTGMMPPSWLAQMPQKEDAQAISKLNGGAKGAAK